MRRSMFVTTTLLALGFTSGCGNDQGVAPDHGPRFDASTPLADGRSAGDSQIDDGGTPSIRGTVSLAQQIACGASTADDCKGILYVGYTDKPVAPPASLVLGVQAIPQSDLRAGPVSFALQGAAKNRAVYVAAMLAEAGTTITHVPPVPVSGDLLATPVAATPSDLAPVVVNLVLDARAK